MALRNQIAIVAGASSGIGRATAEITLPFQAVLLKYLNVFSLWRVAWIARRARLEGWKSK